MKRIGVIGTGYVGLVQGVVMAEFGMQVICMDVDRDKIARLSHGEVPIYEPELDKLLERNVRAGRLAFSTDIKTTVEESEVVFIAVPTPPMEDGSADLRYVMDVAEKIGTYVNGNKIVVDKSTVPVGTGKAVKAAIEETMKTRGVDFCVDVVSNPEFLREGQAVHDCMNPNRVVLGAETNNAIDTMREVYDIFVSKGTPFLITNLETAEMIKYAANAFLAVKISFINEMALLSDKVGADVEAIARGMGMDNRISPKFLNAGPGYGGSCFPKDTKAIVSVASMHDEDMLVIRAAIDANEKQKKRMVARILSVLSQTVEKTPVLAVWGLSFKPETDDCRDAPSIDILRGLVEEGGVKIKAYCPQGMAEAKKRLSDIDAEITYCKDEFDALKDADALILMTEWNQFKGSSAKKMRVLMKGTLLFDLRNVFSKNKEIRSSFDYYGVGCL